MANAKKKAPALKAEQQKVLESYDTTAARIRYLKAEGYATADVARILNIRYQWVRNVLVTPLKNG